MDKNIFTVINTKKISEDTTTITLSSEREGVSFISGQFLTVYFPETGVAEGKAYSITSAPHEGNITLTVKDIGVFSHKISNLSVGDSVVASSPYGFFYSEENYSRMVFLASGIGVAPFRSLVVDYLYKNPSREIHLHYSVSRKSDAIFLDKFLELAKEYENFTFTLHVTKENLIESWSYHGRIFPKNIVSLYGKDKNIEYFICGSISFVRDMWSGLEEEGVQDECLYTEAFFT